MTLAEHCDKIADFGAELKRILVEYAVLHQIRANIQHFLKNDEWPVGQPPLEPFLITGTTRVRVPMATATAELEVAVAQAMDSLGVELGIVLGHIKERTDAATALYEEAKKQAGAAPLPEADLPTPPEE